MRRLINYSLGCGCILLCTLGALCGELKRLDPAAWGSDHVGKPVPEYTTGDECLFCHRTDIGPTWSKNRHELSVREPDPAALAVLNKSAELKPFADDVQLVLGGRESTRFLKKGADYGRLDLLTTATRPHWDTKKFAEGCAGCHTTAVDPRTRAFSAIALDCYTCHGDVPPNHSKDQRLVYLSRKRQDSARVVTSICAQCHVRTGKSRSTGQPYPNNFVAGDNLFRDFQVDLSPAAIESLNPADRHVLENVRDVVVLGKDEVTCLSCHDVHRQSTRKHRTLEEGPSCVTCHNETGSKKVRRHFEVHSRTCEY
jgi:hypothetical protein